MIDHSQVEAEATDQSFSVAAAMMDSHDTDEFDAKINWRECDKYIGLKSLNINSLIVQNQPNSIPYAPSHL